MILSILIPTLTTRRRMCAALVNELQRQINGRADQAEIVILEDEGQLTTGAKRNKLIEQASGDYIVFFDDDDWPAHNYVDTILSAAGRNADAIAINGYMTTDGKDRRSWRISKDNPYKAVKEGGRVVYLRYNNHIGPIKRSIAAQFKFPDITTGEDFAWASAIHEAGAIQTEAKTTGEIYHYRFITLK